MLDPVVSAKQTALGDAVFLLQRCVLLDQLIRAGQTRKQIEPNQKADRTCFWTILSASRLCSRNSSFLCCAREFADLAMTLYCSRTSSSCISNSTTYLHQHIDSSHSSCARTFSHRFCRSFIKLLLIMSNSAYCISCAFRSRSSSLAEFAKLSPSSEPAEAAVKAR